MSFVWQSFFYIFLFNYTTKTHVVNLMHFEDKRVHLDFFQKEMHQSECVKIKMIFINIKLKLN